MKMGMIGHLCLGRCLGSPYAKFEKSFKRRLKINLLIRLSLLAAVFCDCSALYLLRKYIFVVSEWRGWMQCTDHKVPMRTFLGKKSLRYISKSGPSAATHVLRYPARHPARSAALVLQLRVTYSVIFKIITDLLTIKTAYDVGRRWR